ncbi:hypothetical protein E2562_029579 [Oryza meyeriana var. granulata]|uniref:Disease resistance R13L4/SHOC-2-like LRR domain-containing protein n=1 Tax=Oryza meyeriana var. granulata TaxID=110450 RepID=A0A6G1CA47_9ORYZ|nr:hypothetical protein E2562_029579 [Oryza meyeriana var. granulata]
MPAGVGNLRSLQELQLGWRSIERYENFAMEVGRLTELRMLEITVNGEIDEGTGKALVASLCGLRRIQNLVINCNSSKIMNFWDGWLHWEPPRQLCLSSFDNICLPRLPAWVNYMCVPQLSSLKLEVFAMEARDLDGAMPMLMDIVVWPWASEDSASIDVGLGNLPLRKSIQVRRPGRWRKCRWRGGARCMLTPTVRPFMCTHLKRRR